MQFDFDRIPQIAVFMQLAQANPPKLRLVRITAIVAQGLAWQVSAKIGDILATLLFVLIILEVEVFFD